MALPTISHNTPSAGSISWTGFSIQYAGGSYTIAAGSTPNAYVWWLYNGGVSPALQSGNALPNLGPDDMILFLNKTGTGVLVPTAELLDGSLIVGGSILAGAIGANQIQTSHLDADVVTADEIAAGAVLAEHVSAGAITTEKLSVGTVGNDLVANGSFEDTSEAGLPLGWESLGTPYLGSIAHITGVSSSGRYAMQLSATATNSNMAFKQTLDKLIPVSSVSGRRWYLAMRAGAGTASTKGAYLRAAWYDANKVQLTTGGFNDAVSNAALTTAWTVLEGQVTPPAAARYMQIQVHLASPSVATNMYVDEVIAREVVIAAQIGDGQIITAKMTANTIAGDRITSNTLHADKITAGTIAADRMIVSDFTNYAQDGNFTDATKRSWGGSGTIITSSTEPNKLKVTTAATGNNDQPNVYSFNVTPGEMYYGECYVYGETTNVGGGGPNMHLTVRHDNGTTAWPGFQSLTRAAVQGQWVKLSGFITIPAGARTAKVEPAVGFSADAVGNIYYFRNVQVRRLSGGELIVDGAITTLKLDAEAVTADKIQANAVTATKILAGAIGTNHMTANSIHADRILANTIAGDKIIGNSILAGHILAGEIGTDHMDANSINGDRILANTLTAAKIQANSITADRIQASAITADKLLVSDRTNYWENPDFELDTVGGIPNGTTSTNTTTSRVASGGARGSGKCLELNALNGSNNSVYSTNQFPVEPGDQFYISFDYKFLNTVGTANAGVGFQTFGPTRNAITWAKVDTGSVRPTTWQEGASAMVGIYTVPAGTYYLTPWITFQNNAETTNRFHVDNIIIRRMNGGELVVDGAITTNKMTANTINGDRILANTLTAAKIVANSIGTTQLTANGVNADRIISNTITAAKLQTNSVVADKILAGAIGTNHMTANTIHADRLLSNTITANKILAGEIKAGLLETNLVLATKIIAGNPTETHAEMSPEGFRVYADDPSDGVPNEVVRLGVAGTNDYFAITKADGTLAASIDQNGVGSFTELNATNKLFYKGVELQKKLDDRGKGIVGAGFRYNNSVNNAWVGGPYMPYLRLDVDLEPYRLYKIWCSPVHMDHDGGIGSTVAITYGFDDPANAGQMHLTKTQFPPQASGYRATHTGLTELWAYGDDVNATRKVSFLVQFGIQTATNGGGQCGIRATGDWPVRLVVEDVGPTAASIGNGTHMDGPPGSNQPAPTPPPAKQTYVKQYGCWNSANYNGSNGRYTYNDSVMYQGLSPAGHGNLKSLSLHSDMTADLSGADINYIRVYFNFQHWYYNSGGTARIGLHGHTGIPGTWSSMGPQAVAVSGGWPKPGARWVDIPAAHWDGFKTGAWRGVTLEGDGTYGTYGYAERPTIEISYNK